MEAEIIEKTIKALEKNNFEVFFAQNRDEAREVFFNTIFPEIKPTCVSWGDSMTMKATGVLEEIEKRTDCVFIQTLGDHYTAAQKTYWRRKALEADLFLSGTNALTQQGQLVNADMIGNRVAGMFAGPKQVCLIIGRNKLAQDLVAGLDRARNVAAPLNARRLHKQTPCTLDGRCHDCSAPQRICRVTSIIEYKPLWLDALHLILVDADLGY